jgi:hypothetical protein
MASTPNASFAEAGPFPTEVNRMMCWPAVRLMAPRSMDPDGQTRPLYKLILWPMRLPSSATC